jgi:hypothetical protein
MNRESDVKTRHVHECRCDERLKRKDEKFTRLGYTGDCYVLCRFHVFHPPPRHPLFNIYILFSGTVGPWCRRQAPLELGNSRTSRTSQYQLCAGGQCPALNVPTIFLLSKSRTKQEPVLIFKETRIWKWAKHVHKYGRRPVR